jgi:5,10-methylenetetrahydrofolate reductase
MVHGPCGGVEPDGRCELGDRTCPFVERTTVAWEGAEPLRPCPADPLLELARRRPIVLCDLPDQSLDGDAIRRAAAALAGVADAVLFGDVGWARVQLPPSYRAALVAAEGVRPWAGLNCRDRNRVALAGELRALAHVGAVVHCVTGDHTRLGDRPDAQPVFDLDSTALAALANATGALVSVAENPVAPPLDERPARVAEKARAGAHVCIINHAGTPERIARFIEGARAAGAEDLVFLACIPLVANCEGLALMKSFTGLALPPGYIEAMESARDPMSTAIEQALRFSEQVLAVPGVAGLNIGAAYRPGDEADATQAMLTVTRELVGR